VCFADLGNARQFVCNYHGWAFGIDGGLKGMHASETYEAAGMDKSEHGLHPVAHVDSYRGLIFATLDPEAPSLAEYLGDMRYYLDAIFDMDEGGTEFIGGCVKSVIQCNWKYASENFVGDILHAGWTHDSGAKAMVGGPVAEVHKTPEQSYHVNFNGHGWEFNQDIVGNCATLGEKELLKYLYVLQPKVAERLGELRSKMIGAISSCTLFPNTSFLPGQNTFRTWHPRGPARSSCTPGPSSTRRPPGDQGQVAQGHHDDLQPLRRLRDGRRRELGILHPQQRRLRHPPAGPLPGPGPRHPRRGHRPARQRLPGPDQRGQPARLLPALARPDEVR
jgi:hypothetical protein